MVFLYNRSALHVQADDEFLELKPLDEGEGQGEREGDGEEGDGEEGDGEGEVRGGEGEGGIVSFSAL